MNIPTRKWLKPNNEPVSCVEKIKVLEENYLEIQQMLQDAIDDAILMGCSEHSVKQIYLKLLESLRASFPEKSV